MTVRKTFITCAFVAAAASALVLIDVRSAKTPNLGEMEEEGVKICAIADDCNWFEQIPEELAGAIEIEPGVTLKQFQKAMQNLQPVLDAVIREFKKDGFVVINDDPGGDLSSYWDIFRFYAHQNTTVEVRGDCTSACTLIVGAIDKSKICFGSNGKLHFHQASSALDDSISPETTQWMFDNYPSDIQNWIGHAEDLPAEGFRTLHAQDLWKMGYHKCAD